MPRFRRSFRGRSATPARRVEWNSTFLDFTRAQAAVGNDTFFAGYLSPPSALQSQFTDPTLVRVRGNYSISLQTVNATLADSGLQVAVGIIPWKDNDDTVPAAANLPSPLLDGEMDWVWHAFQPISSLQIAAAATIDIEGGEIDSKAMRRMPTGFGLLWVLHVRLTATADSAVMVQPQVGCRMLYKE